MSDMDYDDDKNSAASENEIGLKKSKLVDFYQTKDINVFYSRSLLQVEVKNSAWVGPDNTTTPIALVGNTGAYYAFIENRDAVSIDSVQVKIHEGEILNTYTVSVKDLELVEKYAGIVERFSQKMLERKFEEGLDYFDPRVIKYNGGRTTLEMLKSQFITVKYRSARFGTFKLGENHVHIIYGYIGSENQILMQSYVYSFIRNGDGKIVLMSTPTIGR